MSGAIHSVPGAFLMRTVLVIGLALVALLLLPFVLVVVRGIRERLSLRTGFNALGRVALDKHRHSRPDDE